MIGPWLPSERGSLALKPVESLKKNGRLFNSSGPKFVREYGIGYDYGKNNCPGLPLGSVLLEVARLAVSSITCQGPFLLNPLS